jgi:adenylate kinase family enzyme
MRVHIIGLSSAGKSTLAEALARHLGCAHHDLDPVAFVDDRWTPRPLQEREAMVARILEELSFVTEGGFLGWTAPLLAAADLIIWLAPPRADPFPGIELSPSTGVRSRKG